MKVNHPLIAALGAVLGFCVSFSSACSVCDCPELAPVPAGHFTVVEQTENSDYPDLLGARVTATDSLKGTVTIEYEDDDGAPVRVVLSETTVEGSAGGGGEDG